MDPLNVVVANRGPQAEALAAALRGLVRSVTLTRSPQDLGSAIAKHRADLAVLDLETVSLPEVEALHKEFAGLAIVCTHRLPDDAMWTASLAAGAIDCCHFADVGGILQAARRNLTLAQGTAA
jgi:hypothetical protein